MSLNTILIILGQFLIFIAVVWVLAIWIGLKRHLSLVRLFLFGIIIFTLGYTFSFYLVMTHVFSKQEIVESHGSFDERLNLLDERVSVLEDATKSGNIKNSTRR